jgi:hypothetical protein
MDARNTSVLNPLLADEASYWLLSSCNGRYLAAPRTWSIATSSSDSGYRALRYWIPTASRIARTSIRRQRRSERTCGERARSMPAKELLGPWDANRLSPTATKCKGRTGDRTAITRQLAQSSPSIEGSIYRDAEIAVAAPFLSKVAARDGPAAVLFASRIGSQGLSAPPNAGDSLAPCAQTDA